MDPTATWNIMTDETVDLDERVEAAKNLHRWLASGGFPPRIGIAFGGNTAARFYIDRRIADTLREGATA